MRGVARELTLQGVANNEAAWKQFYKGWSWRTGRMICAVFVMGQCKDILGPLMFPHRF